MRRTILMTAGAVVCTMVGTACAVPSLPGSDSSAEVSVVNADAAPADPADVASSTPSPSASSSSASGGDADATGSAADPTVLAAREVAGPEQITVVGDDDRMSTNPDTLTRGWGYLTVDGVTTTDRLDDQRAPDGTKFVLIDYQLLGGDSGNFFDEAFRLRADGQQYSPVGSLNEIVDPGRVVNDTLVFEVPVDTTGFRFEAGAPDGSADGFAVAVDVTLVPAEGTDAQAGPVEEVPVEAVASEVVLVDGDTSMSTFPGQPTKGRGTLTVDGAISTAKIEQDGAAPGRKFVVIDYQLLGVERGNFMEDAFRLQADGEWYSPLDTINEIAEPGRLFNGQLRFEVPAGATEVTLEGGMPPQWTDGSRTTYRIAFPATATADEATSGSGDEPATEPAVEATASDIALVSDQPQMTTDPGRPGGGVGTLTVDGVSSTAKIDVQGAAPGFKFVVVDYQVLGVERGNLFEEAFRMEAGGEWYSPRNGINEIVSPGSVLNGQLVFEVPVSATEVVLEAGMPRGAADGATAVYEIRF